MPRMCSESGALFRAPTAFATPCALNSVQRPSRQLRSKVTDDSNWPPQKAWVSAHRLPRFSWRRRFERPLAGTQSPRTLHNSLELTACMHGEASAPDRKGATMSAVGFIGLGIMGSGMARNLFRAGHSLYVWNRTRSAAEAFAKELVNEQCGESKGYSSGNAQVHVADSPRSVAGACNVIYSMLSTPEAALSVHLDAERGTVQELGPQKMLIECSTLDVSTMERLSEAVHQRGALFLEAPVSGSKVPAQTGTLIFLCSGDRAAYDRVASSGLDVMGKASFFLGERCGVGTKMKIVVNMIMGSMMVALAEGASLAESCGLSTETLNEILGLGAMNSPLFSMKLPNMISSQYEAHFPLKHQQKDLRFAISLGDEMEQWLPLSAIANEVFKAAQASGFGDYDFSAVVEALRNKKRRPSN